MLKPAKMALGYVQHGHAVQKHTRDQEQSHALISPNDNGNAYPLEDINAEAQPILIPFSAGRIRRITGDIQVA